VLVLPEELTHDRAQACSSMLAQALRAQSGSQAVADASALRRFDSSALAVLLDCRREALAMGKSFAVHQMPARLRELAMLYGVGELLSPAP
jgi:phospholipid transport system transporter-binding protein